MLGTAKKLSALKLGCALFRESADAFEAIVRMETLELGLHFTLQSFHQGIFFAREDILFDGTDGELRSLGDFFGKRSHPGFELVGGKEVIEDAQTMRGLRVDHFAEIEHFRGDRWAHNLRQKVSSA